MGGWEYMTLKFKSTGFMGGDLDTDDFSRELNAYGQQGWEAVSCFDTNYGEGTTRYVFVLMKRKL